MAASPAQDSVASESGSELRPVEEAIDKEQQAAKKMRVNQRACIACQQIAVVIWQEEPERTIASVVRDERIRKYRGGAHYADATVRKWIKSVAPSHVREKRGAPTKEYVGGARCRSLHIC